MRSDAERLRDVIEAADRIAARVSRGRAHLDGDEDAQLALVRLIEIIGEACANVSAVIRQRYPEVPWSAVAGMRNRVIHGYFDVDLNLVWTAAEQEVPSLAAQVRRILEELDAEEAGDGDK